MRNTITVMNAKGGVGKSTLVLALAETLATHHSKKVLVIDSDAHASISNMLMSPITLDVMNTEGRTVIDYFINLVLRSSDVSWRDYVIPGVSDVDDARSVDLMTSGGHLTLFEREVSKAKHEIKLRHAMRMFFAEARHIYDFILIDSAPGLSILTECWLREADFYLSPTKPDYISTRGLQFLREFSDRNPEMGFAEQLGVVINMKDQHSAADEQFDRWLRNHVHYRCFNQPILRATALQEAAHFCPRPRSYWAKYPGYIGKHLRQLSVELLSRVAVAQQGCVPS